MKLSKTGLQIHEELGHEIENFRAMESKTAADQRVVTQAVLDCHATQFTHFNKCFPPIGFQHFIQDRFGRKHRRRGTGTVECLWRHLRAKFPERVGLSLGLSLLTAIVVDWNFRREQIFDDR